MMMMVLLLSLLAASGFSQNTEWIYYNKDGADSDMKSVYRIKPDGTENELIIENNEISDISEDGLKILFLDNNGIISLVNSETMDTLSVDNGGINARFTYDENVIIYLIRNPGGDQLYKYSFIDSSETLIADSCSRYVDNGIMSPDKQKLVFFQTNQDSFDVVIIDIQSGQTLTLQSIPNNSNPYVPSHTYWGLDDYIYLNLLDSNNVRQLFRLNSSNGDEYPTQLTEEIEGCQLLASNDTHLGQLVFAILGTVREYWLYDFESNEKSYLGDIEGSTTFPAYQTWSNDNTKIAIGGVWTTGIYTPGTINIFDTVENSITTLVDSTWPPYFFVGDYDEQISIIDQNLPVTYALYNAYPNPFNPITTLKYNLSEDSFVDVTVYDMLGNVVNNLVNKNQNYGSKSVQWNATNNQGESVSAGVYLYKIQAGDFSQTKKMVLLK